MTAVVYGLKELSTAFAEQGAEASSRLTGTLRDAAEPVKRDAESLGQSRIPRIGSQWWHMRTGVTRSLVYVAPRERGARGRDNPRRREKFAPLLMGRAMEPALDRNEAQVERTLAGMFDRLARDFNK